MKLHLLLAAAVGLFLTSAARADDAATRMEVEKAIKALNEAFAKNDAAAIKKLITEDHVGITPYYDGMYNVADQLKSLPEFKVSEYAVSQQKITFLTKDVALVTYQLKQKGTFKGKELIPNQAVAAVWVRRDGKWLEASYQETAVSGR